MKYTFIYGLFDPRDPELPRYIGKTNEPSRRLGKHLAEARSDYRTSKNKWLASLVKEDIAPQLVG